jgi:hypothetical protein
LRQNISFDGIQNPFPGVAEYLHMEKAERREKRNLSKYNKHARGAAKWALWFLTEFAKNQDEKELAKVLTSQSIRPMLEALVGDASKVEITNRHYDIAKRMISVSTPRIRGLAPKEYKQYVLDDIERAERLVLLPNPGPETRR